MTESNKRRSILNPFRSENSREIEDVGEISANNDVSYNEPIDLRRIIEEIKKVINGKDEIIEKVLMCIIANGHVVVEDKPGVGKTTLVKTFAAALGLDSSRIQFTNDLLPSDITGYVTFDLETKLPELKKGPVFDSNLLLADEINRASAKSQSALLEVMEERQVTLNGKTYKLEDPFIVMGTMNPYNSPLFGVSVLPQSQLDRFMLALSMGYADQNAEINMLKNRDKEDPISAVQRVCSKEQLLQARKQAQNIFVHNAIYKYVTDLANGTRNNSEIEVGISPRGEIAIVKVAKARAYLMGRDYVIPDDVSNMFIDASIHRITLKNNELTIISDKRRQILSSILRSVPKPSVIKRV